MDIRIEIGREVNGSGAIRVAPTFKNVSRHHATLYLSNGVVTIEDNGSTNGTFVNGRPITRTQVQETDTVWLGGNGMEEGCYRLNLREILAPFKNQYIGYPQQQPVMPTNATPPAMENSNRTDYSAEFNKIKDVYIKYHEELSKLKQKANTRMQLPRLLLSLIPAVLGFVFMYVLGFGSKGFIAMMIGSVLSGVIGTLTMGRSTSKQEKLQEDIMDLQLKYKNEYKCPKCGKEYNLDLHWKKLKSEGKCPYGCGAQF